MEEQKGRVVIGLDIGGGNVTVYTSIMNNGGDPTPTKALVTEQEASIFALFEDGRDCWGNGVLEMTAEELAEAQCLKANFKAPPGTGNDEDITAFAKMVFKTIRDNTKEFYGLKPVWVIGCPASWPRLGGKVKEKYAALFRKAGMEDIIICEESTAAVSYYDRALKVVTKDNTSKGVLLIDWGSTTTDATFILPPEHGVMKQVETSGCALGAHFIDRALVHAVLYKQEDYGLWQLKNDEELTEKVRRKYEGDEDFRRLLDCHARIMKETYFRAMALPGLKPKRTQLRWKETVNLSMDTSEWGEGETFYTLGVSIQMMEDILSAPIREIVPDFDSYNEFTRKDIGNDSFIQRNERFLEELHDKYTEYARAQDALIMLTGGASQMDFVRRSVGNYFPNHKIDYDNHPELSIGKGLAYYGREALQKPGWEEMIEREVEEEKTGEAVSEEIAEISKVTSSYDVESVSAFEERFDKAMEDARLWDEEFCQDYVKRAISKLIVKVNSIEDRYYSISSVIEEWMGKEIKVLKEGAARASIKQLNSLFEKLSVNPLFDENQEMDWMYVFDQFFDTIKRTVIWGNKKADAYRIIKVFTGSAEGKDQIRYYVEAHWKMVEAKLKNVKRKRLSEIQTDSDFIHKEAAQSGQQVLQISERAYAKGDFADECSEDWQETIKRKLKKELKEELKEELKAELKEELRAELREEARKVFDEDFDEKKFQEEFDRITTTIMGSELEKFYQSFSKEILKEIDKSFIESRQSDVDFSLREWEENEFKILQEKNGIDLVKKVNDSYKTVLRGYGIFETLFLEREGRNWIGEPEELFSSARSRMILKGMQTERAIHKAAGEWSKMGGEKRFIQDERKKLIDQLEKRKSELLCELEQRREKYV